MPNIVQCVVSQQVAPAPNNLQKKGAFISWGGTVTAPGTITLLTEKSSLTPYLFVPKAITSLAWSGGVVTVTTTQPHYMTSADVLQVTIAGVAPAGYNGTFNATVTGASTFTYPLASNPGSATQEGTWQTGSLAELQQMNNTFWAQGAFRSVSVLELGPLGPTNAVAALTAFITATPNVFYSYLVPRTWDGNSAFLALLPEYSSPNALTYFWITTTLSTWQLYQDTWKDAVTLVECPVYGQWQGNNLTALSWSGGLAAATTTSAHGVTVGEWFQIAGCEPVAYNGWFQAAAGTTGETLVYAIASSPGAETELGTLLPSYAASTGIPNTEFSQASGFWKSLSYAPSATNQVTSLNYAFVYGVTPFPVFGNNSILTTLKNGGVNVIGTGAQGGITNTIYEWGTTMDGNKFNYWYATDWMQINCIQNLANAIINGSNNPVNPLKYNQAGINTLEKVLATTTNNAVTFGMVLFTSIELGLDGPTLDANLDAGLYIGSSVVNAVPFITYSEENPDDYGVGLYTGFSVIFTPQIGFDTVIFNLVVTDFVASS